MGQVFSTSDSNTNSIKIFHQDQYFKDKFAKLTTTDEFKKIYHDVLEQIIPWDINHKYWSKNCNFAGSDALKIRIRDANAKCFDDVYPILLEYSLPDLSPSDNPEDFKKYPALYAKVINEREFHTLAINLANRLGPNPKNPDWYQFLYLPHAGGAIMLYAMQMIYCGQWVALEDQDHNIFITNTKIQNNDLAGRIEHVYHMPKFPDDLGPVIFSPLRELYENEKYSIVGDIKKTYNSAQELINTIATDYDIVKSGREYISYYGIYKKLKELQDTLKISICDSNPAAIEK